MVEKLGKFYKKYIYIKLKLKNVIEFGTTNAVVNKTKLEEEEEKGSNKFLHTYGTMMFTILRSIQSELNKPMLRVSNTVCLIFKSKAAPT